MNSSTIRTATLLVASLLFACLANPGMPLPWLVWVALVPLFVCAEPLPRGQQTLLFGCWGLLWWAWSIHWLVPAAIEFIGLPASLAVVLFIALCFVLSAPYWLVGFCWNGPTFANPWLQATWRAALFACAVGLLPTLLPASLASGQYVHARLIQIADIGGAPLLLFAVVLCNVLLASALRAVVLRERTVALLGALAIPALLWTYGELRLRQIDAAPAAFVDIGWVQPNLRRDDPIDGLLERTRALAAAAKLDLIVWPEFPPAFSWSESAADRARVDSLLRDIATPLLLNSGYVFAPFEDKMRERGGARPYFNAVQLISAEGELRGSYHKQRLVPFFEYLPYEQRALTLRRYFPHSLAYVAGPEAGPIRLASGIVIAPLICYEMIFPALAQHQVDAGATIFINPGNDGWFGASRGSISHVALSWLRSVEQRRPWLRVANSGIGMAVDAGGRPLMGATPVMQVAAGHVRLALPRIESFYSAHPHAFGSAASALLLAGWAAGWRRASHSTLQGGQLS